MVVVVDEEVHRARQANHMGVLLRQLTMVAEVVRLPRQAVHMPADVVEALYISKSEEHFRMMEKSAVMQNQERMPLVVAAVDQFCWKTLD